MRSYVNQAKLFGATASAGTMRLWGFDVLTFWRFDVLALRRATVLPSELCESNETCG